MRVGRALHVPPDSDAAQRTLRQKLILAIGSGGYVGYLPASGAISVAVIGVPLYLLLALLPGWAYAAVLAGFTLLSVGVHSSADRILREKDSGKIVLDEVCGFLVAMTLLPAVTWQLVLLGFVVERGLDVAKPWPAGLIERRVAGGWGVVGDDLGAGSYACLALHLTCLMFPAWVGLLAGPLAP
jgi:phosphatidylglycerophosphatase A